MRGNDGAIPLYHTHDLPQLSHALYLTVNDLINALDERAVAGKTEASAKVAGYFNSGSSTERGREMDGKQASITATISGIELDAQIAALTEEKYLILKMIELRLTGVL